MVTVVILCLIFVATPLAFMFATRERGRGDQVAETGTNPELLRRPPRSRYPR